MVDKTILNCSIRQIFMKPTSILVAHVSFKIQTEVNKYLKGVLNCQKP